MTPEEVPVTSPQPGTVTRRWMTVSTDGRAVLFEVYADSTIHMVVAPEGASGMVPINDCTEALYDRHGTLIVSREP